MNNGDVAELKSFTSSAYLELGVSCMGLSEK